MSSLTPSSSSSLAPLTLSPRYFPSEIIGQILCQVRHFNRRSTWLWRDARLVSRSFKVEVERIFKEHHLKHTSIFIDIGRVYTKRDGRVDLGTHFEFDRFLSSEDDSLIVLKADTARRFKKMLRSHLELLDEGTGWLDVAQVEVRREVRDTLKGIVGLKTDWENLEITCPWRSLLSTFYFESSLQTACLSSNLEAHKARMEATLGELKDGPIEARMFHMFDGIADCFSNSVKFARRDRIGWLTLWELKRDDYEKYKDYTMEQAREIRFPSNPYNEEEDAYEDEDDMEDDELWDGGEEKRILKQIQETNQALSWDPLEDDEPTDKEEEDEEERKARELKEEQERKRARFQKIVDKGTGQVEEEEDDAEEGDEEDTTDESEEY